MRIALIQDQLLTPAGSERVFLYMAQEFREADVFTLCYNASTTLPEFRSFKIRTHWLGRFIPNHAVFKLLFPIATFAMELWSFSEYDLVLTSSATTAKYVRKVGGPQVCYCYFPTRAIWDADRYFGSSRGLASRAFRTLLPYLKRRDFDAAQRVTAFIAISASSREGIRRFYKRDAEVLFCPVDVERFSVGASMEKQDYFLLVSRLERWKLVEYAVEAFNVLGLPLRIVGDGPESSRLKTKAASNIQFLGKVDDEKLMRCYGEARAVIFTPELEYGLVPIEAVAAGTPVIALGRGGVRETMIGLGERGETPPTAVFFDEPTASSLIGAVRQFEGASFSRAALLAHARQFGIPAFKAKLRAMVEVASATLR
jgi:glycosyltransferase involved in cell wall biosynthesis